MRFLKLEMSLTTVDVQNLYDKFFPSNDVDDCVKKINNHIEFLSRYRWYLQNHKVDKSKWIQRKTILNVKNFHYQDSEFTEKFAVFVENYGETEHKILIACENYYKFELRVVDVRFWEETSEDKINDLSDNEKDYMETLKYYTKMYFEKSDYKLEKKKTKLKIKSDFHHLFPQYLHNCELLFENYSNVFYTSQNPYRILIDVSNEKIYSIDKNFLEIIE